MSGRIVLAIDTCSPKASFALAREGKVLATLDDDRQLPHSQSILANLGEVLRVANVNLSQIDIFAGNTGPGSFTGVRVGLASLKGLGQALNREVIGVNALDLTALSVGIQGSFLVLLEAGRQEVFAGKRIVESNGLINSSGTDLVSDLASVIEQHRLELENRTVLVGSGVAKYSESLTALAEKMGRKLVSLAHDGQANDQKSPTTKCWVMQPVIKSLAPTLAIHVAKLLVSGHKPELQAYYIRSSDEKLDR